jgi:hypothetical protein
MMVRTQASHSLPLSFPFQVVQKTFTGPGLFLGYFAVRLSTFVRYAERSGGCRMRGVAVVMSAKDLRRKIRSKFLLSLAGR